MSVREINIFNNGQIMRIHESVAPDKFYGTVEEALCGVVHNLFDLTITINMNLILQVERPTFICTRLCTEAKLILNVRS